MIDFDEVFGAASRSAVHLEMRDVYAIDNERETIAAWKAGHRHDPEDRASWWNSWHDLVASTVGRGVEIRRARIVSEPASEYIRYEYDGTVRNIVAGEQVRWLPRRQATDIALPGNDFWLIDDETVVVNHFSGDGRSTGGELIGDDPALAKLCGSAFETVWSRAVPHEDYHP